VVSDREYLKFGFVFEHSVDDDVALVDESPD
jgi:hypothetical protein